MSLNETTREFELQKLLSDERDRCTQYKSMYETMKGNYTKVQEDLVLIRSQLKEAVTNKEKVFAANESTIRDLDSKLTQKIDEINSLNKQLQNSKEISVSNELVEELTNEFETKLKELNGENDRLRESYNSQRFENVVIKCNLESKEADYARTLDRMNHLHHLEVEQLKMKMEYLEKDKSIPTDSYALELKSSKREVVQLDSRVKTLLSECEELRAQNENLSLQIGGLNRTSSKQISDHAANLRLLESEKSKIQMEKEILEKELSNTKEHRKLLTSDIQSSKREMQALKEKLEETDHHCRLTVTNLKVEIEQQKSMFDSDRDTFTEEISRLKTEIQAITIEAAQEQQSSLGVVQSLEQNLGHAHQQLWKRSREWNNEKEVLEKRLQEVVAEKDIQIAELGQNMALLQNSLGACASAKNDLEKELSSIRNSVHNETAKQVERHPSNYDKDIQYLKEKIDLLSAVGPLPKTSSTRSQPDADYEVVQLKLGWEQQKLQYQQRLEELESQLRELRGTTASQAKEAEFKLKQYTRQFDKLKERVSALKSRNEELESQKAIFEQNVPADVHLRLQQELERLQRQVGQYSVLIATEPAKHPSTDKLLTDIHNIQFQAHRLASERSPLFEPGPAKTPTSPIKSSRRRSLKSRRPQQNASAAISSSSDLDLENL